MRKRDWTLGPGAAMQRSGEGNGPAIYEGAGESVRASGGIPLLRLRKEVKDLREEREILKKAATFFAREEDLRARR